MGSNCLSFLVNLTAIPLYFLSILATTAPPCKPIVLSWPVNLDGRQNATTAWSRTLKDCQFLVLIKAPPWLMSTLVPWSARSRPSFRSCTRKLWFSLGYFRRSDVLIGLSQLFSTKQSALFTNRCGETVKMGLPARHHARHARLQPRRTGHWVIAGGHGHICGCSRRFVNNAN